MKHLKYVILGLCFVFTSSVFSQKIIKVKKPYVLIDISRDSGYQIGDECLVYHPIEGEEDKLVGVVELMAYKENQCAAKIIKESTTMDIQEGDIIAPYQKSGEKTDKIVKKSTPSGIVSSTQSRYAFQRKSQLPSYISLSAGILSCTIGYYYYHEAEKNSELIPANTAEYEDLKDETKKFDNTANFCFGLGGGLVAYSIINYILTRRTNLKMSENVSIVPVHKRDYFGMGITVNLNNTE